MHKKTSSNVCSWIEVSPSAIKLHAHHKTAAFCELHYQPTTLGSILTETVLLHCGDAYLPTFAVIFRADQL